MTPYMQRLAAVAVANDIPIPARTWNAIARSHRDRIGPNSADSYSDAEFLAALKALQTTDAKLFAADASGDKKRQSPASSGYDKITQANEASAARESNAAPSGAKQHMERWSREHEARLSKASAEIKLDMWNCEYEAFTSGRRA
jgi:hypothetical protein